MRRCEQAWNRQVFKMWEGLLKENICFGALLFTTRLRFCLKCSYKYKLNGVRGVPLYLIKWMTILRAENMQIFLFCRSVSLDQMSTLLKHSFRFKNYSSQFLYTNYWQVK